MTGTAPVSPGVLVLAHLSAGLVRTGAEGFADGSPGPVVRDDVERGVEPGALGCALQCGDHPKVSASRYFNSERPWLWDRLDALLIDAEKAAKGPLTGDLHQETLRLWRAVVEPTAPAGACELFDVMARYQQATADLSGAYFEIRRLEDQVEALRKGGHREPPEAGPYLQQARLAAGLLRAQREVLRAQAAECEARLPAGTGLLHDPELPVPGREPAPSWWAEPVLTYPGRPSAPPPYPFLTLGPHRAAPAPCGLPPAHHWWSWPRSWAGWSAQQATPAAPPPRPGLTGCGGRNVRNRPTRPPAPRRRLHRHHQTRTLARRQGTHPGSHPTRRHRWLKRAG